MLDLRLESTKTVIVLKWSEQKVILKSSSLLYKPNNDDLPKLTDDKAFIAKVVEVVNFQLALDWPEQRSVYLIEMLWPSYKRTNSLSVADKRSIWSLITQDEYITFSVLSLAQLFPRVMGTCGHFYASEYIIPFKLNSYFYGSLRAKILLHLRYLYCNF